MTRNIITLDANEAVAYVAYRLNEVIAIYPITPSSGMGEYARCLGRSQNSQPVGRPFHRLWKCNQKAALQALCMAPCKPVH